LFRLVLDEERYAEPNKVWVRSLTGEALQRLRWLQLGEECGGHLIVDLREGRIRFRYSEVVKKRVKLLTHEYPEYVETKSEQCKMRAWQWSEYKVTCAGAECCRVVGGYLRKIFHEHEVLSSGWTAGELLEMMELAQVDGAKDKKYARRDDEEGLMERRLCREL